MYRKLYFTGIVAYAFMLLLSVLFYKERIIFTDNSFVIFQLVRDGHFCIQIFRFGDAIAQILPWLGYKMGWSLDAITMGYSVGFMLNYIACYLICGLVLRQYRFALIILMINLLVAADTFYWPISQASQGMALLMVVFATLWDKPLADINVVRWVAVAGCLVTLAFFHPLMVFALGYSIVFFLLRRESRIDNRILFGMAVFYISILVFKSVFFRTEYEKHALGGLRNFITLFPDYFTMYSNKEFLLNCLTKYYWIPILLGSVTILYGKAKQYSRLGFFAIAVIGYLMLVNIMYPTNKTPLFYIENLYLPLSLFLALPLVFDLLPVLEQRQMGFTLMVVIMITGGTRIYATHSLYTDRLNWERNFLSKNGDRKIIADAHKANAGILQMLWGSPFEFWQLSTIEQGHSASIIIDDDPQHRDWAKDKKNALVVNWNIYLYSQLNPKYFHFTDSTTGYFIER